MYADLPEPTAQALLRAISTRRSAARLRPDCPPRELIKQLLEAAIHAPNHHLNQPWRFVVLAGKAREAFGDLLAERLKARLSETGIAESAALIQSERRKPLRAPVLIVVASVSTNHPKASVIEDVMATSAAVTHMMLAATALGLGTFWRTGGPACDPEVKTFFGLQQSDEIVALLYVGYPESMGPPTPRDPVDDKTAWRWADDADNG